MDINKLVAFCNEYDSEILLADGFEEAFLGVGSVFHDEPVAVYDKEKCIKILADDFQKHSMEITNFYEQALEYFEYNVQGSYVGDKTPIFLIPFS